MATYNSTIGYQTLIDSIEPFFKSKGFTFNIPPYDRWINEEVDENYYLNRGWNTYINRENNYNWFMKEDDHDSYSFSGFFSRKNNDITELIQFNMSPKKTVVPVFGIDIPEMNEKLNNITNSLTKFKRIYYPFATLYHDMMWSTWSGGTEDADDIFLSYASDKKLKLTENKIYNIYDTKIEEFFKRGISQKLFDTFKNINFFSGKQSRRIATLENEELIFWYYLLSVQFDINLNDTYNDIRIKLNSGDFNENFRKSLLELNDKVLALIKEK